MIDRAIGNILRGAEAAFLAAMANGYVQEDIPKKSIRLLPGSKVIPFDFGDYRVIDEYFTTPGSDRSFGHTLVYFRGKLVWEMQYAGRYGKAAIPFLKQSLRQAYLVERKFYGGRGPRFFATDKFTYTNTIEVNSFIGFNGQEQLFSPGGVRLGYHWYSGMSLLKTH